MIETVKNEELKEKKEELLKNMKMLRHTIADMLSSKSFFQGLDPGAQNGVITVNGEQFPVYITANTLGADGLLISDDIYDEENYLSLISDDDLFWYALVEHLAHQVELLQNENNQLREDLAAADNEIEGLEEDLREANKRCSDHVKDIDKLEVDNERLSERVRSLVCEKCDGKDLPLKFGEQERLGSKQAREILEDCEASKKDDKIDMDAESEAVIMELEEAFNQQQIAQLNIRIAQLESARETDQMEIKAAQKANDILKEKIHKLENNNAFLKKEKQEAELLAYRLTRGDMHVQFDSMQSLEHDNSILKNENAELNQKLYQKEDEDDLKKKIAEYAQKNDDLLERNKRLNQEIGKIRVQLNSYSGATVVDHDDMQQKITKEAMAELTAKINELEEENDSIKKKKEELLDYNTKLRQEITSLRINAGLSVADSVDGIQEISSILEPHEVSANDDMKYTITNETVNEVTARIKELESIKENLHEELNSANTKITDLEECKEELLKEIDKLKSENADFTGVCQARIEEHIKHMEYRERQTKLLEHFKNLANLINDLMEMSNEDR